MLVQERVYTAAEYRFGFNGKEKDEEVSGSGNSLDFGARIYDGRLGRFLTIDPLFKKFPMYTSYLFAGNDPIKYIDIYGEGPGDVVVLFAGANVFAPVTAGLGSTPNLATEIELYQKEPGTHIKAFSSKWQGVDLDNPDDLDIATNAAFNYIIAKYNLDQKGNDLGDEGKKNSQVVIYGYSWGGALVNHLAKRLAVEGITVDLLVTVDAAGGSQNNKVDRYVHKNVKTNLNIYQTIPEILDIGVLKYRTGSRGDINTQESPETLVLNYDYTYYTGTPEHRVYEPTTHSNIDEHSLPRVVNSIISTLENSPKK